MLDIKALEQALAAIGNIGKGEITFVVDGLPVTMRVLSPDEDIAVQRYAREILDDEEVKDDPQALTFVERFKRATLSYAIIQVGSMDLRGVDSIATGEVLENGTPVRVQKHIAMRKIIDGWSRTATLALFQKYNELLKRVDATAERAIHFEPDDLDAEIVRVEKRLAELKQERERLASVRTTTSPMADAVVQAAQAAEKRIKNVATHVAGEIPPEPTVAVGAQKAAQPTIAAPTPTPPPPTPAATPVPPAAHPQQPSPSAASQRSRVLPPAAAPPARPVETPARPAAPPPSPEPPAFAEVMNSMGDSEEALAAETARLQAARLASRRASMDAVQQDAAATIPVTPGRRVPPHREAASVANAVFDTGGGSISAARPAPPVGGVDAYRLPTETLTDRAPRTPAPRTKAEVNAEPPTKPNNPRFRTPHR